MYYHLYLQKPGVLEFICAMAHDGGAMKAVEEEIRFNRLNKHKPLPDWMVVQAGQSTRLTVFDTEAKTYEEFVYSAPVPELKKAP